VLIIFVDRLWNDLEMQPRRAKRLHFEVIPNTADEY